MTTYTREGTLEWLIDSYQKEADNQAELGTREAALKAVAARQRVRELQEELATVQAESLGDTREAALADRARHGQGLDTPADPRRVELDRRVQKFMEETGESNYARAAKKVVGLIELEG